MKGSINYSEGESIFYRLYMPYCLHKTKKGYVILNREYKPLGVLTLDIVDYSKYSVKIKITSKQAAKLSYKKSEDLDRIYLYNDGCNPSDKKNFMEAYLKKLAILAKMDITFSHVDGLK